MVGDIDRNDDNHRDARADAEGSAGYFAGGATLVCARAERTVNAPNTAMPRGLHLRGASGFVVSPARSCKVCLLEMRANPERGKRAQGRPTGSRKNPEDRKRPVPAYMDEKTEG
jgi:hypothetical protein